MILFLLAISNTFFSFNDIIFVTVYQIHCFPLHLKWIGWPCTNTVIKTVCIFSFIYIKAYPRGTPLSFHWSPYLFSSWSVCLTLLKLVANCFNLFLLFCICCHSFPLASICCQLLLLVANCYSQTFSHSPLHAFGTARYCTVRHGTVRHGTTRYGTARYCTVRYFTVLYDTVRYCTVRYDTVPDGTCCTGVHITQHDATNAAVTIKQLKTKPFINVKLRSVRGEFYTTVAL